MSSPRETKTPSLADRGEALDYKLGRLWGRFWAIVVGIAGVVWLAWFFTGAESPTLGSATFSTAIGVGLLLVARHLWRNKDRLTSILDEAPERTKRPG
jgi:hypothetical protein